MLRFCKAVFAAALLIGLGLPSNAFAQGITTGSISGTTVDSAGAVIRGAQVNAINTATGAKYQSLSGAAGDFSIRDLPIGTYTLTLSAPGFAELKVENIAVTSGNQTALGKETLQVGSSTTEVTVEGTPPLLETTQSSGLHYLFRQNRFRACPWGTALIRSPCWFPGQSRPTTITSATPTEKPSPPNGQRGRSNNFELDGQSNNDNSVAGPQIFFGNQDAIQELQVITNNFSAQYGRNMGSVINYLTKSGTNSLPRYRFRILERQHL